MKNDTISRKIYSKFKKSKNDSLIDILKSTKSNLANNSLFNQYIHDYMNSIQIPTYKKPNVSVYPMLRSSSIIPLKKTVFDISSERKKLNWSAIAPQHENKDQNFSTNPQAQFIFKLNVCKPKEEDTCEKERLLWKMKSIEKKRKRWKWLQKSKSVLIIPRVNSVLNISMKEQYDNDNCLIEDLLYKWKDNKKLKYNEHKIFDKENRMIYDAYINERWKYVMNNKIENSTTFMKSEFEDGNCNWINLELRSMNIIFEEIPTKGDLSPTANNQWIRSNILLPFAYWFWYYYKGFDIFQYILLASITFDETFSTITFNDDIWYDVLRNNAEFQGFQKWSRNNLIVSSKGNNNNLNNLIINSSIQNNKKQMNNFNMFSPGSFIDVSSPNKKGLQVLLNNVIDYTEEKKTIIYNSKENDKNESEKFKYNKYQFYWQTPAKAFKVEIVLPMITWRYETSETIIHQFVERDLWWYWIQKNFINWDFYIMSYLFSFKRFRGFMVSTLSFQNVLNEINNSNNNSHNRSNNINNNNNRSNNIKQSSNTDNTLFLTPGNIYKFTGKEIKFPFYYTDKSYKNYWYFLKSYSFTINYNKWNPHNNWEFNWNFFQMKFLNEVSLYEPLETFLLKILHTDFSRGWWTMDETVYNEFNPSILDYQKKETLNQMNSIKQFSNKHTKIYNKTLYSWKHETEDGMKILSTKQNHGNNKQVKEFDENISNKDIDIKIDLPCVENKTISHFKIINSNLKRKGLTFDIWRKLDAAECYEWPGIWFENRSQWDTKVDDRINTDQINVSGYNNRVMRNQNYLGSRIKKKGTMEEKGQNKFNTNITPREKRVLTNLGTSKMNQHKGSICVMNRDQFTKTSTKTNKVNNKFLNVNYIDQLRMFKEMQDHKS